MEVMKPPFRVALFAGSALLAAACGSTVDAATDQVDAADQGVEVVADAVEVVDEPEAEEVVVEETTTTTPTTTAAPAAQESVTATTVHETTSDDFPDILAAEAVPDGDGTWRFNVTVSSTYDTAERYADAWRVVGPDGTEFGVRVLTHDHQFEQPFTRSQSGIAIPADVTSVTIEGRDLANGWGGGFLELDLS